MDNIKFDKQKIVDYIESKHMNDGGYFFARVTPSSGADTFYATYSLKLLDYKTKNRESIIQFWKNQDLQEDLLGLFYAISTFQALNEPLEYFNVYNNYLIKQLNNDEIYRAKKFRFSKKLRQPMAEFGTNLLYLEYIQSELQNLFFVVIALKILKIKFDAGKLLKHLKSLKNNDGGFGTLKGSQISTTFYALSILHLIDPQKTFTLDEKTKKFIYSELTNSNYLEELFWAVQSLNLEKLSINNKEGILNFVARCWKEDGGFTRSRYQGITNLEYTFYALNILKIIQYT